MVSTGRPPNKSEFEHPQQPNRRSWNYDIGFNSTADGDVTQHEQDLLKDGKEFDLTNATSIADYSKELLFLTSQELKSAGYPSASFYVAVASANLGQAAAMMRQAALREGWCETSVDDLPAHIAAEWFPDETVH